MAKNNRHQLIITNAEIALLEAEHALELITELDNCFQYLGQDVLTEDVQYTLADDNGQELQF